MQPGTMAAATTTTTEIWQWQCPTSGADWKMVRQVMTSCPHGCRCWQGTPSAGNLPPHHHHHHRQEEGTRALAGEGYNAGRDITLNPAPLVAQIWVPDPYLMVQQLREFEPLNEEVVALRVQLEEYTEEIERSNRDNAGTGRNLFLALPANIRSVLLTARDAIDSFAAICTRPPVN